MYTSVGPAPPVPKFYWCLVSSLPAPRWPRPSTPHRTSQSHDQARGSPPLDLKFDKPLGTHGGIESFGMRIGSLETWNMDAAWDTTWELAPRACRDCWRVSGLAYGTRSATHNETQGVARGLGLAPGTQGYGEGRDSCREAVGRDKRARIRTVLAPHHAALGHSHASRLVPGPPSSCM
jgi:hypothetical protein